MRKSTLGLTTATTAALFAGFAMAGEIDPTLQREMDAVPAGENVSALFFLQEQLDVQTINADMTAIGATMTERHELVVRGLQDLAQRSQGSLVNELQDRMDAGLINDFEAYWVANLVRIEAPADQIAELAGRLDVQTAYFNYGIELVEPVARAREGAVEGDGGPKQLVPEIGLDAIRAPEVWNDLGFDGSGILVSSLDTGVDGNHPAVASAWKGVADARYAGNPEWAYFDPVTFRTFPADGNGHGTHTMGTIAGGAPGDEVGVAPGAEWIHCAVIDRISIARTVADSILSFQWLIDPDGNPGTNWDVPVVCSNSWGLVTGHGYPPCDQTFWTYLDNCEAAGIFIVFAAGNEGGSGLRRPGDRATTEYSTFAVASVDANRNGWPISSFSSRGPTNCTPDGRSAIKPDISAPGENVRSSVPGGGYSNFSGTSMATPHIAGVVALMREANANMPIDQLKQIIFDTAVDLGSSGEDNSYGYGMVDAYEAVLRASGVVPSCSNLDVTNLVAGQVAEFKMTKNIERGEYVAIVYGFGGNDTSFNNFAGFCSTFGFRVSGPSQVVAQGFVDINDEFVANIKIPGGMSGTDILFQGTKRDTCDDECMTNVVEATIQ